MVSYDTWIEVAYKVAEQKGMDTSFEESQNAVSAFADIWNRRKADLQSATRSQARSVAQDEITVS